MTSRGRPSLARASSVSVSIKVSYAADEGVRKALLNGAVAPFFGLVGFLLGSGGAFEGFAEIDEAFGGVGPAVEQNVFDEDLELGLNVFVDLEHAGIDDAHVHASSDGVKEEGGMHGFADLVVAAEGEGYVGHAARDLGVGGGWL